MRRFLSLICVLYLAVHVTSARASDWVELPADDPLRFRIEAKIARAFDGSRPPVFANTKALLVVYGGKIACERYGPGLGPASRLQSWSMAKSMLHAALGIAFRDGLLRPDDLAPVLEWQDPKDPRRWITIRQLAQMTDGLGWSEDYGDTGSAVMQMLFGAGRGDTAAFAAKLPQVQKAGAVFNYSGGSANILSRLLRDTLGGGPAYSAFLRDKLFLRLGMASAVAEFDASGTWIASSYVHASARDYARFGQFYLQGGQWGGAQLIDANWMRAASKPSAASKGAYGALFWLNARHPTSGKKAISDALPEDVFLARGFGGQFIGIFPSHNAVIVMLNASYTDDVEPVALLVQDILNLLPPPASRQ